MKIKLDDVKYLVEASENLLRAATDFMAPEAIIVKAKAGIDGSSPVDVVMTWNATDGWEAAVTEVPTDAAA